MANNKHGNPYPIWLKKGTEVEIRIRGTMQDDELIYDLGNSLPEMMELEWLEFLSLEGEVALWLNGKEFLRYAMRFPAVQWSRRVPSEPGGDSSP